MAPMYGAGKAPDEEDESNETSLSGFVHFFRNLEPVPKGTLRIFDRTEFYTCYGHDALYVAKEVYRTNTVLRYLGKKDWVFDQSQPNGPRGLPSCSLNRVAATGFLRDCLTSRQLRVQVFSPVSGSSAKSVANTKWQVSSEASPGNLEPLAELLFSQTDLLSNPIIASVWFKTSGGKDGGRTVGVTWADVEAKTFGVAEFAEREEGWGNLESFVIQLGVKEVLLPTLSASKEKEGATEDAGALEWRKVREAMEGVGVVVTECKRAEWNVKSIEMDVNRLLKGDIGFATMPEYDLKVALPALNPLISYLQLLSQPSTYATYKMTTHHLSHHLRLDPSAVRALHLFPESTSLSGGASNSWAAKTMSLFGLLNRCKTAQGTRLLGRWLKQPLVTLHSIEQRQMLVAFASSSGDGSVVRETLREDHLRAMPDLVRLSKRFERGKAGLEEVVRGYQAVERVPEMITVLEKGLEADEEENPEDEEGEERRRLVQEMWIAPLTEAQGHLAPFCEMVETTLDLDQLAHHQFVIKPSFDEQLTELQQQLEKNRDGLDEEHRKVARELGFEIGGKSALHFEVHQVYSHVFRLTRKEAGVLRGKKGFIELSNRNNGTHFTTKALKELNAEQKDLTAQYEKKQSGLVKEVINIAASYCPILEKLNEAVAHVDVVFSLAHVSLNAPIAYVRPKLHPKGQGDVVLKECRHPCLEVQEDISFIPNDVTMKRGESEFSIITGPNMGGKSTYIRQVGVVALMAQIGCNVPCAEASLPIFDSVLARVGAGDSQVKGVSTFMAEMLETATILKAATKDSLIIIDELGRGTSTYDGFGLAWAISEHIATEIRAFCLFASHFHELTALSAQLKHVRNLHVVAHVEESRTSVSGRDITLLYKVEEGVCDQSFGIHVAELAHFPEEVVKLAKRKADELEDFGDAALKRPKVSDAATAQGTALVEEMLKAWVSGGSDPDGGAETAEADKAEDVKLEREKERLVRCFEQFKDRLDGDEWCQKVLAQTY